MSDLSRFDTREKADAGVEVPLVVQGKKVLGTDKKPVTFTIRGEHNDEVALVSQEIARNPGKTPAEVRANDFKLAQVAVIGWSDNFLINGEAVPFSESAIPTALGAPIVRRAVLLEVYRQRNFMNGA